MRMQLTRSRERWPAAERWTSASLQPIRDRWTAAATVDVNSRIGSEVSARRLTMKLSRRVSLAFAVIAVSGCAMQPSLPDARATTDRRSLTVDWCNDPSRDISTTYAHAEARTDDPVDASMELAIDDPAGGEPLVSTTVIGDGSAEGGSCYINEPLQGIPSGSRVVIRAVFRDKAGTVTSTKALEFVRP